MSMGVYIKGMEMPKSCRDCGIEQEGFWCGALDGYQNTRCFTHERREDCPLVPVPPHGDLIERKTAYDSLLDGMVMTGYQSRALDCIAEYRVPTVIPASGEGET